MRNQQQLAIRGGWVANGVLADAIDQQIGAAVLVETEQDSSRWGALDREWRILDDDPSRSDGLEARLQGGAQWLVHDRWNTQVLLTFGIVRQQVRFDVGRPIVQIVGGKSRGPAAPVQRASTDGVRQPRKVLVAPPRIAPHSFLPARVFGI